MSTYSTQRPRTGLAVVGNPRPGSRTQGLARTVLGTLSQALWSAEPATGATLDLAELSESLGAPLGADVPERWSEPLARLHSASLLVVATPVYKGSYSGLLKAFLDQVDGGALAGTVAVPVVAPGSPAHTLAADVHLRPLLVELGASVPTRSLVVLAQDLAAPQAAVDSWLAAELPVLTALLAPEGLQRNGSPDLAGDPLVRV